MLLHIRRYSSSLLGVNKRDLILNTTYLLLMELVHGKVQRVIKGIIGANALRRLRMNLTWVRTMAYTLLDIPLLLSCTDSLGKNIPKAKPMIS